MSDLLAGVRVLEAAVLLNGDYIGMLLGDLGADVIKLESPGAGDYLRDMLGQITPHNSPAHVQVNKNKRSITLDVRGEAGKAVLFDLLQTIDVFVDGYVAGTCDRLGIGYDALRAVKPDIVYCHYSGFGDRGPYRTIPTHGQMMNALAAGVPVAVGDDGLVHHVESDEPMGGTKIGGDGTAAGGTHAALHIAAALVRRDRTGQGCYLDAAGSDGVLANGWMATIYGLNDERITDRRNLRPAGQPQHQGAKYQWYQTADERFILFCCIEHKFWERFCTAVDHLEWLVRSEGAGPVDFAHTDQAMRRELQTLFRTRTQAEWVELAIAHRLPIGPSHQGTAPLRDDPHLRQRTILFDGEAPTGESFTYVGEPVIVDRGHYEVRSPAPRLGEHTDAILGEIGYDATRIAALRRDGIV
jgi:crotonobetainyl-CoA:carnitine CoA-transferase CaiB-like acyl-CoA transferase